MVTSHISSISEWRRTWRTKTKSLSITGCTSLEKVVKVAIHKAHSPSVLRALDTHKLSSDGLGMSELVIDNLCNE